MSPSGLVPTNFLFFSFFYFLLALLFSLLYENPTPVEKQPNKQILLYLAAQVGGQSVSW